MQTKESQLFKRFSFFLITHIALFSSVFGLKLLGITTDIVLLVLSATVFIEVIYLAFFTQTSVNRNLQGLEEVKKNTEGIWEDEVRIHTTLIHLGHQMKTIQHDLDSLKRKSFSLRAGNSNASRMKIHA